MHRPFRLAGVSEDSCSPPWKHRTTTVPCWRNGWGEPVRECSFPHMTARLRCFVRIAHESSNAYAWRSEEHTSELQSPCNLVCRLLLEKKKIRCDRKVACG